MKKELIQIYTELKRIAPYDKLTKTYHISKENYQILGLNNLIIRNKIKKLCTELGVNLEYPNKPLPDIKGQELFPEYNYIKSILETTSNIKQRSILEQRRTKIRNLITEYNMDLIKLIINRRVNNSIIEIIKKNNDIEELYQVGYEFLINYIDTHYLEREQIKYYIDKFLNIKIKRVIETEFGINTHLNKDTKKLSKSIDLEEDISEYSSNLDKIVTTLNYTQVNELYYSINSLEELFILKEQKELFYKILKTLKTEEQEKIIILSFGLDDEEIISGREIGYITRFAPETVRRQKERAIKQLSYPARSKYIKQIMGLTISKEENDNTIQIKSNDEYTAFKNLEQFLLKQLDINLLESLTENINPKLKAALLTYLGYIEKSKTYISDNYKYLLEVERSLNFIRKKITETFVKQNKNEEITNYLDYLMYYYLNKPNKKIKTKTR